MTTNNMHPTKKEQMTMPVTLSLPPDTEQLLREKAALCGQTLEAYLQELAEREAHPTNASLPTAPSELPPEEWVTRWYAWATKQPIRDTVLDDSRESIYAGRGE
jgi:hypothetical protein